MSSTDYFPFGEGMPTGPDVNAIIKTYPTLEPGDSIPRDALYKLLGLNSDEPRGYKRLRTVMQAFERRMMREHAYVVMWDKSAKAYRIALPKDVLGMTGTVIDGIKRAARKQRKRLGAVSRIASDDESPTVMHQERVLAAFANDAKKARMNLIPQTKADVPPQIEPPKPSKTGSSEQ